MPPKRRRRRGGNADDAAAELLEAGRLLDALTALDKIICSGHATFDTWRMTGQGLIQAGEHAQAIDAFDKAVELDENNITTRFNLAGCLYQMGDVATAVDHFERLARQRDHFNSWCNLATVIPGDPRAANDRVLEVRRAFSERIIAAEPARITSKCEAREPDGRMRVGYVSAFFDSENYMKPVWELLRSHDRSRFEVYLFADDVTQADLSWFTESAHDRIHITTSLSNQKLVELIRLQQLDVLVDLNAYSVPLRLPIYVSRLAPVVAAWFNMYATSGLPGIDWIIGDEFVVPEDEESAYSETVARLPQSYLSFDVVYEAPPIVPPPCLSNGYVTFGSLISQYKITPEVYAAWATILKESQTAKCVLANRSFASECNRDDVLDKFDAFGVDRRRIQCLGPADHVQFLQYYNQIDIALDAFPYNGGTTTTEAIWQGVPTLAFNGDRWASRTSRTLLMNSHLSDFVADSVDGYVAKAIHWAQDESAAEKLSQLRATMRDELRRQPVCDVQAMVAAMEATLEKISHM
jgi:protein O-GlcNAc transferase